VENNVHTLHEEIEHLVGHLVENNVDTLREEKIHLVEFSFIRVYYRIGQMNSIINGVILYQNDGQIFLS